MFLPPLKAFELSCSVKGGQINLVSSASIVLEVYLRSLHCIVWVFLKMAMAIRKQMGLGILVGGLTRSACSYQRAILGLL